MGLKLGSMLAIPVLVLSFSFAQAADKDKKPTPQQERMQKCNADAKGMKGDERKKFMSGCLKGKAAAAEPEKGKALAKVEDKGKAVAKGAPEKGKSAEAPTKAKKGQ